MKQVRLGKMQLRIMRVLWQRGPVSARQITEALSLEHPVAHSTVQTLLRKLEAKGAIRHEITDRTFIFYPAVDSQSVTRSATRELIERVFGGSAAGLVAHLLKEERISPRELTSLREMIDQQAAGKKGKP
jgi:BlaI family penicillinase repressor